MRKSVAKQKMWQKDNDILKRNQIKKWISVLQKVNAKVFLITNNSYSKFLHSCSTYKRQKLFYFCSNFGLGRKVNWKSWSALHFLETELSACFCQALSGPVKMVETEKISFFMCNVLSWIPRIFPCEIFILLLLLLFESYFFLRKMWWSSWLGCLCTLTICR